MKIFTLTVLLCLARLIVSAQETEIFIATQCGNPMVNSSSFDGLYWNYSFGVEHYIADKITIAVSYRKMFGITDGSSYESIEGNSGDYSYYYTQNISSYAIDFESKYFFDAPDEGWYMSTGISYQHLENDITVSTVSNNYGYNPIAPSPVNVGVYPGEGISIFPLSLKFGHRNSSDTFVFDYFFGMAYNMGIGNVTYQYGSLFDYDGFKRISYILGIKAGVKL